MSEIEKIERYIERTKLKGDGFSMSFADASAMARDSIAKGDICKNIILAFEYGRAKGYRAAKAEVQR